MSGERIAEQAGAYLALVDDLAAMGHDPAAEARAVKTPPTDDPTRYSEAVWVRAHRDREEERRQRLGLPPRGFA